MNALAAQCDLQGRSLAPDAFGIVLFINNTADDTADLAHRWGERHALRLDIREVNLESSHAHAGGARGAAMDWAASRLDGDDGLICTTDADSMVSPTWIAQTWRAIDEGADAVAGVAEFDRAGLEATPFPQARRLEARYAALQAEVMTRADPEAHNPWPNHLWAWGASFAVTRGAYRAIGGVPAVPLGEDRAMAAMLRLHDFRIRHALAVRVTTSRRHLGRAPGGLADLIRAHDSGQAMPCDDMLEPILQALERASSRRRLKMVRAGHGDRRRLARRLGVPSAVMNAAVAASRFGQAWSLIEAASPRLMRTRLTPDALPLEIARAERILRRLRAAGAEDPADSAHAASAGLWSLEALPAG